MFKKLTLSILAIALLGSSLSISAAKPTSIPGKIGAGLIQFVHRHTYLLTIPAGLYGAHYALNNLCFRPIETADILVTGLVGLGSWYVSGRLLKTATKITMDMCNIDPVQA